MRHLVILRPMERAVATRPRTMDSAGTTACPGSYACFTNAISYSARSVTVPTVSLPVIADPFVMPDTRFRNQVLGGGSTSNLKVRSSKAYTGRRSGANRYTRAQCASNSKHTHHKGQQNAL